MPSPRLLVLIAAGALLSAAHPHVACADPAADAGTAPGAGSQILSNAKIKNVL
jgi:hypothetical protein